jgi:hypothetical protein
MCGDDDDLNQVDEDLYNRFLNKANKLGVSPEVRDGITTLDLNDPGTRSKYMEDLFKAGLTRAVNDADGQKSGDRMDIVAGQAIVFARLAGLLAGQFPPESDLFHTVVSALMDGHKETHPS